MNRQEQSGPAWQSCWIVSPIGRVIVAGGPQGIRRVILGVSPQAGMTRLMEELEGDYIQRGTDWVEECQRQIEEYFLGGRRSFAVELDLRGTPFQRKVWREIGRVRYGRTRTYGVIARRVGKRGAARAVGRAAGANPVPLLIPCHRVVGAGKMLGGFGSGVAVKIWLLDFEARNR